MEKDKLEPKLRFPGFTEPWEHRKFGELFTFLQNNTLSRADLYPKGIAYNVHYGDVLIKYGEVIDLDVDQAEMIADDVIVKKYLKSKLQNGDLIFADTAEDETVGKTSEIQNIGNRTVISGLHTIPLRPKTEFAFGFLGFLFSSVNFRNELKPLIQGIKVSSISKNALKTLTVKISADVKEQAEISNLLLHLSHAITLHQRKEEELQKLKKGLLQKMFPKDGESVPEIRFPNFTDSWEHRKLGNISKKCIVKNTNKAITETFTNSAEHGIVSQRDFFDKDIANQENISSYYVVNIGDFVYNPRISSSAPCGPISRNKLGRQGIMSPLYTVFSPSGVDLAFLEQYFKTSRWYSYMYLNGDTGARADRFAIKDKSFFDMPIATPSSLNEQEIISTFLDQTDYHITLHHRKTEELKKLKKALLQQMFV